MSNKKRIILFCTIAVCAIALGVAAALIFSSLGSGGSFRSGGSCAGKNGPSVEAETPSPTSKIVLVTPEPSDSAQNGASPEPTEEPTPEPTEVPVDPYEELLEKADTSMMKDIVNILLVGVDYSTERETWNGKKEWHSDVMMVLAVNFEENRADLISLPRDTYAEIPNIKGIYKLNASLNCGGGLYNSDGSFNPKGLEKVCDAAEWMLGGIPVDYYYAVTMTSLKELVDLCGGLEYDMDVSFKIQGRSYQKGMQHINGQAFLDYCRVRKPGSGLASNEQGDANRVNRQKRMLVAMFKQLKAERLITKIPDLLQTFNGDLFTNCTFAQTAALAAFAYNLEPENIGMYSMGGTMASLFQWNFCFTNQSNRVDIVQKVYHKKVKQYTKYTYNYARYHWCDLLYDHYMDLLNPLTKYVQKLIDEDDKLPEFTSSPTPTEEPTDEPTDEPTPGPTTPPPTDTPKPTDTPEPTDPPTPKPTEPPTDAPEDTPEASADTDSTGGAVLLSARNGFYHAPTAEPTRKYTKEQRELFEQYKTAVKDLEDLHKEADKQAKKARNGSSNSLGTVGQTYLKQLADTQALAIQVAKTFGYTKVKDFTVAFAPTGSGWSKSPWAFNYGRDKKFNEIIVDFN